MKKITRRGFIGAAATAGMATALTACSSGSGSAASASASASSASASASASASSASASASAAAAGGSLRFVSGGEAGTYYALATLMAQHASANAGLNITAVSSGGSQANVNEIEDGTAQLGFCQSDVEAYAFEGTNIFADQGAVTAFSTVANLYEEQIQLVTVDESIKSPADLAGKNVSIGAAGSGVYFNAIDVLGAYGLTEADIKPTYQSFADSTESLKDGKIDAAFVVAGAPTSAVTDLFTTKQGYLVEIDAEHAAQLIAASPYYNEATIPAGTYNGQDADITTLSVGAVVIAADSVSEDDVYAFVSDIFENLPELQGQHDKFKEFSLEKAASVTAVPYHPGAAKYFAEKGITVATK